MGNDFDASWDQIAPTLVASVEKAQSDAGALAVDFVPAVLDDLNVDAPAVDEVLPESLVGVTGGGVPLEQGMYSAVVASKQAVGRGATMVEALSAGADVLQMMIATALSDTGRAAESLGIASRPGVGYIRMLEGQSCPRCIILAGRFYRWSAGFKRHPRCDCRHIPATRKNVDRLAIDPGSYFRSLPQAEQDGRFGAAAAQAIRDGADMSQVVNADKGMRQAQVYGQNLRITTEGVTKRGVAGKIIRARGRDPVTTPRLMPSAIYDIAEDRADALRLLRLNGYIANREGVPLSGAGSRTGLVDLGEVINLDRVPVRPRVLTEAEGRTAGSATWRPYVDTVPATDAALVRIYTGNGYEDINSALRDGDQQFLSPTKRDTITALDTIIDKAPRVPEPVTVSRAVDANVFGLKADSDLMSVVGKPFTDDAFMSTAFQSRLSRLDRHEVEIRLDVPAGSKGVYVSSHEVGDDRSLAAFGPDENELILARGTRYEFTDAFVEDGRRVLVGRVVEQGVSRG
ncbi:ADP-ribosyltransferase [Rhodococcoides fascians]|uniref:ADP-ribosyltransferase n=1 Tax=Rhodococcoides fascians TaxID=1828 RepID=UPI00068BEE1E|nr:ADP-ribosyltransferase [Rhodococcus fascians]